MAVIQKKWQEMITKNNFGDIIDSDVLSLGTALDGVMISKYALVTQTYDMLSYVKEAYLTVGSNLNWNDLPIWLSSYKEGDKRVVIGLKDRLKKYLRFYQKVITDDGLARQMTIDRSFNNVSADSDTNKNYVSDTPQEELDNFETAIIKYASSLTKDERSRRGNQNGTSNETAKNTSWDEGMKNLRLVFYNDLVEFISSIPNILYNYYCLDSRPYPALAKEYYKGMFNAFKIVQ